MAKKIKWIASLGDPHCPFLHVPTFDKLILDIEARKRLYGCPPYALVWHGDSFDLFALSKFPRRIRLSPDDELNFARVQMEQCWTRLRKVCGPRTKFFLLKGNHDERAYKRALEKQPEILPFLEVGLHGLYSFQDNGWKVETIHDSKQELEMEGIIFIHGHRTKWLAHLREFNYMPVVYGHTHRGGVLGYRISYRGKTGEHTWEANPGYLANPFDPELMYRPMKRFFDWTWGWLVIEDRQPTFRFLGKLG